MAEVWEILLSIFGAGVVGYAIHWFEEKWRRTREKEMEYRKELRQYLPDLFEPLFKLLGDLWYSLIDLANPEYGEYSEDVFMVKGRKLTMPIREAKEALANLMGFVNKNEDKLDLLLPHPLQSWQYGRLRAFVNRIIEGARIGKISIDDLSEALHVIMNIRDDLQKILGFEMKIRLKSERIFESLRP